MKLVLRGHHLLCLKGFQGYGYSEDFTKNMTRINAVRKENSTTVTLADFPDDICSACPKLDCGLCENEKQNQRIVDMDRKVLEKFDASKEYDAVELFEMVDSIFNTKESLSEICCNCIWHEKCLFYQKL